MVVALCFARIYLYELGLLLELSLVSYGVDERRHPLSTDPDGNVVAKISIRLLKLLFKHLAFSARHCLIFQSQKLARIPKLRSSTEFLSFLCRQHLNYLPIVGLGEGKGRHDYAERTKYSEPLEPDWHSGLTFLLPVAFDSLDTTSSSHAPMERWH